MDLLDAWLDARDAESVEKAWSALYRSTVSVVADPTRRLAAQVGARLALAWLGVPEVQVEWLERNPTARRDGDPAVSSSASSAARSWLDGGTTLDFRAPCEERWDVETVSVGARGVQRVSVGFWVPDENSCDGGGGSGATVVRVFDKAAGLAVSVTPDGRSATLLARDAASLDSLAFRALVAEALDFLAWNRRVLVASWQHGARRALVEPFAALAREVDPAFADSAHWPVVEVPTYSSADPRERTLTKLEATHTDPSDASRSLSVTEYFDAEGTLSLRGLTARGLAGRARLDLAGRSDPVSGFDGNLTLAMPARALDRVLARLLQERGASVRAERIAREFVTERRSGA